MRVEPEQEEEVANQGHPYIHSTAVLCDKLSRKGLYKKQKRLDWDHKAYDDAPSAI